MSCPHCFKGGIHDHATPTGEMATVHGVSCYVTSPSTSPTSKSQIIFLCDAFGLNLVNNKLLADRYASDTGMKVLVPEVIPGGGAPVTALGMMDGMLKPVAWLDFWGQLARIWSFFNVMATMVPFMMRANAPKSYPPILAFARAVKKEVTAGGGKLGACGFCWGAYASTRLCTEPAVEGDVDSGRLIDAQFNAHPSRLKTPDMILDAITTHKVPYSCAIGDNDMVWSAKSVYETQAALKQKVGEPEANDYEIRIYPGCTHGFNARAKPGDEVEIKACEDATRQAVDWWKKYLV